MIESCSRRRMILAIAFMIGLSIIVVVIENKLTPDRHHQAHTTTAPNMTSKDMCWTREKFEELEECQPCTALQTKSGSPAVCSGSSYYQKIKCNETGIVHRRCDKIVWLEEREFWIFETIVVAIGFVSGSFTFLRQKTLDAKIWKKIQQQVAAGV